MKWSNRKKVLKAEIDRRKKKVIEGIEGAERSRVYFTKYLSRSGCHPCDRSEAGHQLSIVNKKIDALNVSLSLLQSFND